MDNNMQPQVPQQPVTTPVMQAIPVIPTPTVVPSPVTPPTQPMPPAHEGKPVGPIIGALIIVIVLIIGALFIWGQKLNMDAPKTAAPAASAAALPDSSTTTANDPASFRSSVDASTGDIDNLNF